MKTPLFCFFLGFFAAGKTAAQDPRCPNLPPTLSILHGYLTGVDSIRAFLDDTSRYNETDISRYTRQAEQRKTPSEIHRLYCELRGDMSFQSYLCLDSLYAYDRSLFLELTARLKKAQSIPRINLPLSLPLFRHPLRGKNGWSAFLKTGDPAKLKTDTTYLHVELSILRSEPEKWQLRDIQNKGPLEAFREYLKFQITKRACYRINEDCNAFHLSLDFAKSFGAIPRSYSLGHIELSSALNPPVLFRSDAQNEPPGYFLKAPGIRIMRRRFGSPHFLRLPTAVELDEWLKEANARLREELLVRKLILK